MKAVLPALARPLIEAELPDTLDVQWFASPDEAVAMAPTAEIGWFDSNSGKDVGRAAAAATQLKWLSSIYAGLDHLDKDALLARGTRVTNGSGLNAHTVAEYAVMGALVSAKRYDQVVRAADRHEWPLEAPGRLELYETKALVIGYGTIGKLIGERMAAFGVEVTGVTRSGAAGTLTPDTWQAKIADFDWIFLAAPSTRESQALIGKAELSTMKPSAWIINVGRGSLIDQDALIEACSKRRIGGAFLDTVTPEPLPPEHPLWSTPNILHSMHLSGRSQTKMFLRGARLFLDNLNAYLAGEPLKNEVDLRAGY